MNAPLKNKERGGGGRGESEPEPSKYVRTEKERLYPQPRTQASSRYLSYTCEIAEDDWELSTHWTTSVSPDNSSLKQVYIPSLW